MFQCGVGKKKRKRESEKTEKGETAAQPRAGGDSQAGCHTQLNRKICSDLFWPNAGAWQAYGEADSEISSRVRVAMHTFPLTRVSVK